MPRIPVKEKVKPSYSESGGTHDFATGAGGAAGSVDAGGKMEDLRSADCSWDSRMVSRQVLVS